jgi:hypothetical protein
MNLGPERHMMRSIGVTVILYTLLGCAEGKVSTPLPALPSVTKLTALDRDLLRIGVDGAPLKPPLRVLVLTDGLPAAGVEVSWATTSGRVSPERSTTDQFGVATATWVPAASQQVPSATATIGLPSSQSVSFSARVSDGLVDGFALVLLKTNDGYVFESARNGSSPAVDTIAVGAGMVWRLDPFDYDTHTMDTFGASDLVGGGFPYANPSEVRAIYPRAGTFTYKDLVYGGTGTVVVR